jgi:hypothetical protein
MTFDEQVARWKEEHGDIYRITTDDGLTVVVREPNQDEMGRFVRRATKDVIRAMRDLVTSCALDPSLEALSVRLDKQPGMALTLGNKLLELSGLMAEADMGKL